MDNKNGGNLDGSVRTDRLLIERTLGGNTHAFAQIIKNTQGLVAQIIFKMISNPQDRLDITQDVYLKAYKSLSGFKFQSTLPTWIARITYNTCLNFLEKKQLVLIDNMYEDDEAGGESEKLNAGNLTDKIEGIIDQNELRKILQIEIDKLAPLYKILIVLYHTEELSYSEIAEVTRLPEGTVKNYLYRARKELKKNLLINYKKEDL